VPSDRKGGWRLPCYVIDHIVPLKRGGPDAPSNMQGQTTAAANLSKEKDKVEKHMPFDAFPHILGEECDRSRNEP
jgi:hypothetical protein